LIEVLGCIDGAYAHLRAETAADHALQNGSSGRTGKERPVARISNSSASDSADAAGDPRRDWELFLDGFSVEREVGD
jgi:hypothetical protein